MQKVAVIGAGIGGIAVAIRLALKGYQVQVFENQKTAGGKLSRLTSKNYHFDAGPSLFTMPQLVDELFLLAKKNPKDYFEYTRLNEVCRYFWEDGTSLIAKSNELEFAKEVENNTHSKSHELLTFLKNSASIYKITNSVFLMQSLHKLKTYLSLNTLKSFLQIGKIDALRSMAKANESFFSDQKMVQYANRFATYNGSNPYEAPATLNVIPHLEQNLGAYFPKGGMYAIIDGLVKLAENVGVHFMFENYVNEIVVKNNKAIGIKANQVMYSADLIVSNMDVYFTYQRLLPNFNVPKNIKKQERSSSALIFYWGVRKSFHQLGLHNILFSHDYKAEFESIFKQKTIATDSTVYINISSKVKQNDAPKDCENWFVMINVPNNIGQDWDTLIAAARVNILKRIKNQFNIDIEPLIETEEILDPRSIEAKTFSYQGSLYGTSSNKPLAAFLRHPNFSTKIKNLYFVGGSVHPGGGIPLSLLSAKITAELIPKVQ